MEDIIILITVFGLSVGMVILVFSAGPQRMAVFKKTLFYKWFRIIGSLSLALYLILEYVFK